MSARTAKAVAIWTADAKAFGAVVFVVFRYAL